MSIFIDQCINRDLIQALRGGGFNLVEAAQAGLAGASDQIIFDYILKNNCILISFDKDFGNILRFDIRNSPGVAVIYIENMSKEEVITNTLNFFKKFTESQIKGRLFIIEKGRIRVWPK